MFFEIMGYSTLQSNIVADDVIKKFKIRICLPFWKKQLESLFKLFSGLCMGLRFFGAKLFTFKLILSKPPMKWKPSLAEDLWSSRKGWKSERLRLSSQMNFLKIIKHSESWISRTWIFCHQTLPVTSSSRGKSLFIKLSFLKMWLKTLEVWHLA